jgi:hypothetical protein
MGRSDEPVAADRGPMPLLLMDGIASGGAVASSLGFTDAPRRRCCCCWVSMAGRGVNGASIQAVVGCSGGVSVAGVVAPLNAPTARARVHALGGSEFWRAVSEGIIYS